MNRFASQLNPPATVNNTSLRPRVTLKQGIIHGIEVKGALPQTIEQFLGVPYAQTTGGEARFRPPIAVESSTEEFDAGTYGHRCPAGPGPSYGEDCLLLNIYRPKVPAPEDKLPVVIYFHGGAFNSGFGHIRDMASFVSWSSEPIIGVSFNYRTGAFGFLPSKLVARDEVLNVGLMDQELLLQWIRDNIAAFGGDIDNITIMGNSAGAHSIGHHLLCKDGKEPLFHRVIMESGAPTARLCYPYDHPVHQQQFRDFLKFLGCEDVKNEKIMDVLRGYSTDEIRTASDAVFDKYNPSVRWPFQPVIDTQDGMIPRSPLESWTTGKWHNVPIMTGFNTNEGAMFTPEGMSTSEEFNTFFKTLLPTMSEQDMSDLNHLYPDPLLAPKSPYKETRPGLGKQYSRTEQAYGHFAYVAPIRQTVQFACSSSPTYLYHFALCSDIKGADHSTHSLFITYSEEVRNISETVEQVSGVMHAYWTSFVVSGDPNKVKGRFANRPKWPAYVCGTDNEKRGELVVFGEGNEESFSSGGEKGCVVKIKSDEWAAEECEFWCERAKRS